MKRISFIKALLLFSLLSIFHTVNSQNVYNVNNIKIGEIIYQDSTIQIVDTSGILLQTISVEGIVTSQLGSNVMAIINQNGNITSANGQVLGGVDSNGNVVDSNGVIIGMVQYGLMVFDSNNNLLGRVDKPIPDNVLAYYFFFRN
ncbi:MAG TPA: hypothetical protein DIU39_08030 [Flavobacteriales bacterium]|nr:hypothetical protein [Flavobacteriales bacterium]